MTDLSHRAFVFTSALHQHRFIARHQHAAERRAKETKQYGRRDGTSGEGYDVQGSPIGYTPEQSAETFAAFNTSRIG